jgi:DNA-binding NtrC family response regulator
MSIGFPVLLLYSDPEPVLKLEVLLGSPSVPMVRASSCQQTRTLLARSGTPHVVFADTTLSDGTWRDALRLAGDESLSLAIIVVNRWDDAPLHLAALEEGAFDVIAPPFVASDVNWLLQSAQWHLAERNKN